MAVADSTAQMPRDENSYPMQVLAVEDTSVTSAALAAGTATMTIGGLDSTKTNIVEVASLADCHIEFGGSGVTAAVTTSRAFPKGVAVYRLQPGQTHMAHLLAAGASAARITVTVLV